MWIITCGSSEPSLHQAQGDLMRGRGNGDLFVRKYSDDPARREGEEQCVRDVAESGTHVLRVHGDSDWPEFAYTIGLFETFRHPELILLGLPAERAHRLLNDARELIRGGLVFRDGEETDALLEGASVAARAVPSDQRDAHFGWAAWYYGGEAFPALQLVWPSRARRFPWDADATDAYRLAQPVLADVPLPEWAKRAPG